MTDERTDRAKGVVEAFANDLRTLQSADSFRIFILKYFHTQSEIENMLNIVGLGELAGKDLANWQPFMKLFKLVAYQEFAKKASSFKDESIRLGLLG